MAAEGARFYSFTVGEAGPVQITLVSLVPSTSGDTLNTAMGLGVGLPNGTDCETTKWVTTPPGLASQLTVPMAAGTYCTRVFDVGNLATTVRFVVRIVHS